MAKAIMVQGTMSNAGKSLLAAGLCRIFKQDGYRVAPFKSQNMALNSFITEEGLEMGRAQVMQAEAAGIKPSVLMNPILLKPTNDVGSQVIVNGEVLGTMSARDYFKYKKKLVPDIMKAYDKLASENDIIVIEGAGSPAEINLKTEDIVNMGMAKMAKAPVLLVGDIDRGGVFAQLIGTVELLEEDERYNSGNKPNIAESAGRGSGWQPAGSSENRSQQGGGTPRWPRSTAAAKRSWPASAAVMVRPSSSLSFTMGRGGRCRSIRPRAAQSLAATTPTTSTVTVLRVRSRWTLWRWHPGTRMASSGSSPVASTSWTSLI